MAYEFRLPDLGEGLTDGEIVHWHVTTGDRINEDDPLVEIANDKTTVEIPSPYAGTISAIYAEVGDSVPVGTVLVTIDAMDAPEAALSTRDDTSVASHDGERAEETRSTRATPLVRKMAAELGIDLVTVKGSGHSGQVTEADLRELSRDVATKTRADSDRRETVHSVRRTIIKHLTTAHREIPAVTFVEECDFTGVEMRLLVPLTLKAVASSLQSYPEMNARLEGDEIVYLSRYDIGVAVQTEAGLMVPVVRDCDARSLEEVSAEVGRLAAGAAEGALRPEELRNSTFTVTSAGKLGGLLATPIVNHPEVAILGLHRIADRPVVRSGTIVVRKIGAVSLTFDHRVVDGIRAAAFCLEVISQLEASPLSAGRS